MILFLKKFEFKFLQKFVRYGTDFIVDSVKGPLSLDY